MSNNQAQNQPMSANYQSQSVEELDLSGVSQPIHLGGAELSLPALYKQLRENASLLGKPEVRSELARLAREEVSASVIYQMLTDILCKAQKLTLEKTPASYRIVANVVRLVLSPQSQSEPVSATNNFLQNMLKVLTNSAYRSRLVALSSDPIVTGYWLGEYSRLTQSPGGYGVISNITSYLKTLLISSGSFPRQSRRSKEEQEQEREQE